MSARRGLVALLTAEIISLMGSFLTIIAVPWLVLVTTGSATRTGLVAACGTVPYVVATGFGGPLIDRFRPRRTAIASDVASMFVYGAIPLLYGAGSHSIPALCGLVAFGGLLRGLGNNAKTVVFPRVVATADMSLTRATGLQDLCSRGALLLGAPLGGVLVALFDAATVIYLDAISFGIAAFLVARFIPADPAPESAHEQPAGSYRTAMKDAFAYFRRDRLILAIMVVFLCTNTFDAAHGSVLVPVWARDLLHSPVGIGLVSGSFALGAVLGNLGYVALAPRLPRLLPIIIGLLIGGAPRFLALGLDAPLWVILAVNFAAGIGLSVVNPILFAVAYERIPPALQARVLGMSSAVCMAGIPVGALAGGWLSDHWGLRPTAMAVAVGYLAAGLVPALSRRWRDVKRPAVVAEPELAVAG